MDNQQYNFLRKLGKDNIVTRYKNTGRDINSDLWIKLKAIRECEVCHLKVNTPLYIHHTVPVRCGGTNTRENLVVCCYECHQKLDAEQERIYGKKTIPLDTNLFNRKRRK